MAKTVLKDVKFVINGVDLSAWVSSVTINESYAEVETTANGDSSRKRTAGLGDHSVDVEFQQDWAASAVSQTIRPLLGATAACTVVPVSSTAVSSTNPSYAFDVLVNEWHEVTQGAVGDLAMSSQSWPISGGITKGTT